MKILEKIGEAFRSKDNLTTEQFVQKNEQQIAALEIERHRVEDNIKQGFYIENNEKRLAEIDREIQGLKDEIAFAKHRQQMVDECLVNRK